MNNLDDLRADWIEIRKSLGRHIAYFEAGNRIHVVGQDSGEATEEFLARLRRTAPKWSLGLLTFNPKLIKISISV